jgi:serine protease DegQ
MTGVKHTVVLVLGCVLFAVALVACGGGPSEAEIEATVESRIEEKQAEDAALEAKAQAMAKAMVEATDEAAPTPTLTHTPTPTSTNTAVPPTSTPVATTLSTSELVERVKASVVLIVTELSGGHFGSGTGIIYSEDGLALTNHHVVAGATMIWVIVTDAEGTEHGFQCCPWHRL